MYLLIQEAPHIVNIILYAYSGIQIFQTILEKQNWFELLSAWKINASVNSTLIKCRWSYKVHITVYIYKHLESLPDSYLWLETIDQTLFLSVLGE